MSKASNRTQLQTKATDDVKGIKTGMLTTIYYKEYDANDIIRAHTRVMYPRGRLLLVFLSSLLVPPLVNCNTQRQPVWNRI